MCAGCLVGAVLGHQWATGGCWRGLDNRALHWVGARSYSVYVLHSLVIQYVVRLFDGPPTLADVGLSVGLSLVATLAVSALSYASSRRRSSSCATGACRRSRSRCPPTARRRS